MVKEWLVTIDHSSQTVTNHSLTVARSPSLRVVQSDGRKSISAVAEEGVAVEWKARAVRQDLSRRGCWLLELLGVTEKDLTNEISHC